MRSVEEINAVRPTMCVCECCLDAWILWLRRHLLAQRTKRLQKLVTKLAEDSASLGITNLKE